MKYILVCCEESQEITKRFREKGFFAFSCDLQDTSGPLPEYHIKADCIPLLNGYCHFTTSTGTTYYIPQEWDLIIAHPPCTYLSAAGACQLSKDTSRIDKGFQAAQFFMSIYNCKCKHLCIENPRPLKMFNLPQNSDVVNPKDFGDYRSKRTYLWLRNLPILFPSCIGIGAHSLVFSHSSSKLRSKTSPFLAEAIVNQWSSCI